MKTGLVALLWLLCSSYAHAAPKTKKPKPVRLKGVVTPCVKQVTGDTLLTREQRRRVFTRKSDETKWLASDEDCVQYDRANVEKLGALRIDHASLKFDNLKLKLTLENNNKALKKWADRRELWKVKTDILTDSNDILIKQNKTLRKSLNAAQSLKKQTPWFEHPAFVASVAIIGTTVVILGSAWAWSQVSRPIQVSSSPLLSF